MGERYLENVRFVAVRLRFLKLVVRLVGQVLKEIFNCVNFVS
jgi:hypothetical protein